MQAAALLSISVGCDTVSRIISGFILDLKTMRSVRPQVYNAVIFLQALVVVLYPFVDTFWEFAILCSVEGALQGVRMAQVSSYTFL